MFVTVRRERISDEIDAGIAQEYVDQICELCDVNTHCDTRHEGGAHRPRVTREVIPVRSHDPNPNEELNVPTYGT